MAKRQPDFIPLSKFGALVAQLESIVASSPQQPPDPVLCFDLLSALVSAIEEEAKEIIVQWQRKCEDALYSLLVLGAKRPIRRLASSAMEKVIEKGDGISIFSRASSLQGWLADCKRNEPFSSAGLAQCLGELYLYFGRKISSGLTETASIVTKLLKFNEDFVRQVALGMLENALEGSGSGGASAAYSESFRIIMRLGVNDKAFIVRLAAARCLKTFASIGGPGLGTAELENSLSYCVKALEDPVSSVRDAFAEALGALLAHTMNQVCKGGKDHSLTAKKLEDSLPKYLMSPFTRASGVHAKDLRIGLTLSWVYFLQLIHLKYHFSDEELQNYAINAIAMLQGNASTDAHALACVLYILRVGAADQLTEVSQRTFLVQLAKKIEFADFYPSAGVAILRILSYLLTALGEVPSEFKGIFDNTVVAALSHSSVHVRGEAALTLRALAEVDPTSVGGLISYGVTALYALRESAANGKGNQLNNELFSLHGQAACIAALVSISPKLPLGYPSRMPKSVLEASKKMLTEFSWNPTAATVEMEAGWLLLASLLASMPKEELEDQVFDILLLWADPFVGGSESRSRKSQDLISDLWVLSAAIEALDEFIKSFVSPTSGSDGILLQPVLAYLSGALSHLSSLTAKHLPNLRPAVDLFTIRILMAYQSISDPMAYKSEHSQILQICTTPFSEPSVCEESSCLKSLLDKRDACLGPWIPGRDSFEDELRSFDGGKDGLVPCVWREELVSFPQACSISKLLVNQMLLCLGVIFASQDDGGKALLLNKIDYCLKTGKKQFWHLASINNACVALLAALKAILGARVQSCGFEILSHVQSIFMGILVEGEITSAHRRACAEGLGLLARLGGDIFTARMTKSLLGELASAYELNYVGSIALSLGCIHRSVGGMALSSLVPATVSSISSLAKSSNAHLQLWSLHALLLTIEAAGLSFVSQVQATLFLVLEILLFEENGLIELRQEIGRIVNAIVAVIGPELAPGSTFFSRCKSVIAEISYCQEKSALFESVRFTQQLVLFAPQAVSVHIHVQSLLPTLSSRQPNLRYLAVSTLHHLVEKYPNMVDEKIEEDLFLMLDEETDSEIGNLVRSTITRLLYASCPTCPSRWLSILHKMVLSVSSNNTSENLSIENEHIIGASEGEAKLHFGEDDEDMIANSSGKSIQGLKSSNKRDKHLRYRTRLFAAECFSHLPKAVGTNPAHFDLSLARNLRGKGSSSTDWLVLHLQDVISLSYQISTGQFVGMQYIGVELLSSIMEKFEKTHDPELPGHLLLEQYQAQLVSAVRSAISTSSSPLLLEAGLQLATKLLTSSILSGDRVVVCRMYSLISRPLNEIKDLCYPSFAEWVACKIEVRLLAAHASIKSFVYQFFRKEDNIPDEYLQLASLLSSSSTILGQYWISILKDYAFISFGLNFKPNFKPFLDGIQSPLVSSKVRACLDEAWPSILEAASLDAIPVRLEADQALKASSTMDFQKSSFISGYAMVRLAPRDFDFLWGLSWLILFHGRRPLLTPKAKTLFFDAMNKYDDNSVLNKAHEVASGEIALLVFQSLSQERFFSLNFLTLDLCKELLQILVCIEPTSSSWIRLVVGLLSQIVQFCPMDFFETKEFTTAAMELFFKCLFMFHSSNRFSKDEANFLGFFLQLFATAELLVMRMNHKKNQEMMITALMSTAWELFRGASTKLCLANALAFFHSLVTFLKSYIKYQTECNLDDHPHVRTVILTWASLAASVSQDCTKKIHILHNKQDGSNKIIEKIFTLCLEEAFAIAKLVYQTQFSRNNDERYLLTSFSTIQFSIRCIQDALSDSNRQVREIGLNALKLLFQKELTETSNIESHDFFLFFSGEVLGDIYFLIQHELKGSVGKESISVIEECLRLLFLFHTLEQRTEHPQTVLKLFLEALLMSFSISSETHEQEFQEINAIARRLVGHLVNIPSSATKLKDVMLSMPALRRQQLQDMIRVSVGRDQTMTAVNIQSSIKPRDHQLHDSSVMVAQILKHEEQDADVAKNDDKDDYDDDWNAFQSFPAENSVATLDDYDPEIALDSKPLVTELAVSEDGSSDAQNTETNALEEIRKPGTNHLIDAGELRYLDSCHHFESDEAFDKMYAAHISPEIIVNEGHNEEIFDEKSISKDEQKLAKNDRYLMRSDHRIIGENNEDESCLPIEGADYFNGEMEGEGSRKPSDDFQASDEGIATEISEKNEGDFNKKMSQSS